MGTFEQSSELFFCICCNRNLSVRRLSPDRLAGPNGLLHRMCKQCDSFLQADLPFLRQRIEIKKLKRVTREDIGLPVKNVAFVNAPQISRAEASKSKNETPRTASAVEKDKFHFHSLSVELYIEGFIKGLEAAGIDRKNLSKEAETAVNNLLHISQTLAGERRRVHSNTCNRADIRRLGRHVNDTSLMVDEYVRAVTEECLERRRTSRYTSSHGRRQTQSRSSPPEISK
jgi:hypothetical protein